MPKTTYIPEILEIQKESTVCSGVNYRDGFGIILGLFQKLIK